MGAIRSFLGDLRMVARAEEAYLGALMKVAGERGYDLAGEDLRHALSESFGLPKRNRAGATPRFCPICRQTSRFFSFGIVPRPEALCASCGALERHRLVWRYFRERTDLFQRTEARMLHLAPEPCLAERLEAQLGEGYIRADLAGGGVDVRLDICALPWADGAFDMIYCSHVLEHVSDDLLAMRELCRVLEPNGWAILLVPITAQTSVEDPSVVEPLERLRLFGQRDHVRRYGMDVVGRLRRAGFDVEVRTATDFLPPDERRRMAVAGTGAGRIFHCRPGQRSASSAAVT